MGKITACNATNDIYAMNIPDIILYLSFIGAPTDQPEDITEKILIGQRKFLQELGADIDGGHTIINPWPIMGGIAVGMASKDDIIPKQINPSITQGEVIITKPLGVQTAMAVYRLNNDESDLLTDYDNNSIEQMINLGTQIMQISNYHVVKTIHDNNFRDCIGGMTDVTGFGLLTHATEMLQERDFDINISSMPIIKGTDELSEVLGYDLLGGCSSETAGAMIIVLDSEKIETREFQSQLKENGVRSWSIGSLDRGNGIVKIDEDMEVIQVNKY